MPSPTFVLVHGAFGDASSWRPVYDRLVGDGHTVLAPPNLLRGLQTDASHTSSVIDEIDGPVVLVGHSYGGAVITVAGSSDKVAGLVYVAGVAPEDHALEPLVDELSGWLRALLRDVLCGHLDSDLRAVADELLAEEDARQRTIV